MRSTLPDSRSIVWSLCGTMAHIPVELSFAFVGCRCIKDRGLHERIKLVQQHCCGFTSLFFDQLFYRKASTSTMQFFIKRTKKKGNSLPPKATTENTEEIDNLGAQFDWLHIPPEESMYTSPGGELSGKYVHLELQMLNPPESVLGIEHRRAKLNLEVTKREKIHGFEHLAEMEHPDRLIVIPKGIGHFGIAGMEEPFGYWSRPHDNELRRLYLMVNRFQIQGAQTGYTLSC